MRSVLAFLAWLILTPVVFIAADAAAQSPTWGMVATSLWWLGGVVAGNLVQDRLDASRIPSASALDDERLHG